MRYFQTQVFFLPWGSKAGALGSLCVAYGLPNLLTCSLPPFFPFFPFLSLVVDTRIALSYFTKLWFGFGFAIAPPSLIGKTKELPCEERCAGSAGS